MEMTGERLVPAPVDQVWRALIDPAVISSCVAGCEGVEPVGENAYRVAMTSKVGPVSARFAGTVKLENIEAPRSYTMRFQGTGAAGFVNGEARVTLTPAATQTTTLHYVAKAQIGGKLAQLGQRLIDGAAQKMADDFFTKFVADMSPQAQATSPAIVETATRSRRRLAIAVVVLAVAILWFLLSTRGPTGP